MNTRPTWRMAAVAGAAAAMSAGALAQQPLYSNASASAGTPALGAAAVTASGVAAPAGWAWSEAAALSTGEANALAGVSGQSFAAGTYRFADDFTVPPGASWRVQTAWLYAYQPGAAGASSPFGAVSVRVWNGVPGAAGSVVVWGDEVANRLTAAGTAGVYRVFNTTVPPLTAPDTTRPVWRLDAAVGTTLSPGTYWLDWQVTCVDPQGEAFSPTATVAGQRAGAGWNARQLQPAAPPLLGGEWAALVDPGKPSSVADVPVALPFVLIGSTCRADYNGQNGVDLLDIFAFLSDWFVGAPRADYNGQGGVELLDIFVFLQDWFNGCA